MINQYQGAGGNTTFENGYETRPKSKHCVTVFRVRVHRLYRPVLLIVGNLHPNYTPLIIHGSTVREIITVNI